MTRRYLAILVISKNIISGDYGLSALEVPWLFFVQGCVSACGDARYIERTEIMWLLCCQRARFKIRKHAAVVEGK